MLLSAVLLSLVVASTTTRAEALGFWVLPLALFRHVSQLEGGSSWLSRLGWGLGEAEVSIVDHDPIITYPARIAFFGTAIPRDGVVGYIIPLSSFTVPCVDMEDGLTHTPPPPTLSPPTLPPSVYPRIDPNRNATDNTGCPMLCPSPPTRHPEQNETWFALVRRGDCDFITKAREVQRLGAKALIVGSQDENLLSMSSRDDSSDVYIPATYITRSAYLNITDLVEKSNTVTNGIKTVSTRLVGEPPWEWYTPILSFLIVLTLPSLLTLCTLLVHRARAARAARLERAPEDIVRNLPSRVWNGTFWEKDRGPGYSAIDFRPPGLLPKAVEGADERTPLFTVGQMTQREAIGASGSVPRVSEAVGITTKRSMPADIRPSASSSVATASMAIPHQESYHQPHVHDLGCEEEEGEGEDGTPEMGPPTLPPPPPLKKTPPHLTQLQRPPSDDGDRPAWFSSQLECAICLGQFEVGDRVRILPCGHIFHLQEVDEWLIRQRKVCPVCKMDVTLPRILSPPPTTRMPSFVLPTLTPPSNWRAALSRRLDNLREWARSPPAQRRTEHGRVIGEGNDQTPNSAGSEGVARGI